MRTAIKSHAPIPEPVHDVTRARPRPLDVVFEPESVAVIGATARPGSVGHAVMLNLIAGPFKDKLFAVNPAHDEVLGIRSYPSIAALPHAVDVAVIVTPAPTVAAIAAECASAGVKGAIVISAGFREIGERGAEMEREILAAARPAGMRIVGPNCFGVMSPALGFNATFARRPAKPGNLGFASQSGALGSAILDWSLGQEFGFSRFISVGSMLDVGWSDIIYFMGDDPQTKSIVIYMESVGDARSFMSAAREVATVKPIIVIKAGRSQAGAKAAASHTGALTGSDAVLDAAFDRCGVSRVDSIEDLFLMSEVLARQPRPGGKRLAILTNAGGPGVLAADALIAGGGDLATLSEATLRDFDAHVPAEWSHGNPADILGDADAQRYTRALAALSSEPCADGLLVILAPQGIADAADIARAIAPHAHIPGKPVLASWVGGEGVAEGDAILRRAGIPTVPYPDAAARMFNYLWRYGDAQRGLYETPAEEEGEGIDRDAARALIAGALRDGRTLLAEAEAKRLLETYGIPTVPTLVTHSPAEAVAAAQRLGFPVAVKLHSYTLTHKSRIGGVVLDCADADAVERAYAQVEAAARKQGGAGAFAGASVQPMVRRSGLELILGSSVDPQFGPVLLFGLGGVLVEALGDRALGLPPLTTTLARRMMERTRAFNALADPRAEHPADVGALEQLLVRFSRLVSEQRRIKEFDINPLLASGEGLIALDARAVLHPASIPDAELPVPAVRPYPRQYEGSITARDGSNYAVRPIRPEDEPLLRSFHGTLSETSVYRRYAHVVRFDERVRHERLARLCFIDYAREMALVALHDGAIVAVGRLIKEHESDDAEYALAVSDAHQQRGIGTELLRRLLAVARAEGVSRVIGHILHENHAMLEVCARLGFRIEYSDGPMARAVYDVPR